MVQNISKKILLHACCAICSGYPISLLKEMGYSPVVYFCNPNLDTKEEFDRGSRCDKCIELRLLKTAQKAKELGIKEFTTSLVISPHKNFQKISAIGSGLGKYLPLDFKKKDGFLKTNQISKELNLYRQNYCGCEFARYYKQ